MNGVWTPNVSDVSMRQERFEAKLELQPKHQKTLSLYSDFLYENGSLQWDTIQLRFISFNNMETINWI
jgi:hypothetical protein